MAPGSTKISKACEPCRSRKVKCDGKVPCRQCEQNPLACTYRTKIRVRSAKLFGGRSATPFRPTRHPDAEAAESEAATPRSMRVDESSLASPGSFAGHENVTATGHTTHSSDNQHVFYGPSSGFAFLRQLYRLVRMRSAGGGRRRHANDEGATGLDMFRNRTVFFGAPSRVPAQPTRPSPCPIAMSQASTFLGHFVTSSLPFLPFFTPSELESLLVGLYAQDIDAAIREHLRPLLLVILGIGALCVASTEVAEVLCLQARKDAARYEDDVSLPSIQFSLLMTEFMLQIGRPNVAYLHVGKASRKCFAMGLHLADTVNTNYPAEELQGRYITLWSLYFYETYVNNSG